MRHSARVPFRTRVILLGLLCAPVGFATPGAAQDTASGAAAPDHCAKIRWPDLDDPALSRAQKIALLEKVLLDSLKKFDGCAPGSSGTSGARSGNTGGGVQGSQGSQATQAPDASSGAPTVTESAPATGIQGDISASRSKRRESGDAEDRRTGDATAARQSDRTEDGALPPNGKLPEDIPPVENDDIIARQFRQAALEETDPVARAKLWNEYRRYKNLPVQEIPET